MKLHFSDLLYRYHDSLQKGISGVFGENGLFYCEGAKTILKTVVYLDSDPE